MTLTQPGTTPAPVADEPSFPESLIPLPVHIVPREGEFRLTPHSAIIARVAAIPEARLLADRLAAVVGFSLLVGEQDEAGNGSRIELVLDPECRRLGPEGYRLDVAPDTVMLRAASPAGLFYGGETLCQLLSPDTHDARRRDAIARISCIEIEDYPRFRWRGAMLDVARHFMPITFLKKFIDLLALYKLNTLHLHLTDDQGWRIEIRKYPRLTETGAFRRETLLGPCRKDPADPDYDPAADRFDGVPHGGYYTQAEIRDVVAYARARHITIVPEIDMPGHAQAAIAAYPESGVTGRQVVVSTAWGIHPHLFDPGERGIAFLQDVLREVIDIFPSRFIHVGGDEAVKRQWKESDACQARIRELGLHNEAELQSYFIRRMAVFLAEYDRRLIGWDEILEGGLPPQATVMSWRGESGGIEAASAGHDVIMAPFSHTYFDYYQTADRATEPLAFPGEVTLEAVYEYDPVPHGLSAEAARHILGAQGQLWTEYMPAPAQVEYMAFPRLAALAEVVWTPTHRRDYTEFHRRLRAHLGRLDLLDVNYRPLDETTGYR